MFEELKDVQIHPDSHPVEAVAGEAKQDGPDQVHLRPVQLEVSYSPGWATGSLCLLFLLYPPKY